MLVFFLLCRLGKVSHNFRFVLIVAICLSMNPFADKSFIAKYISIFVREFENPSSSQAFLCLSSLEGIWCKSRTVPATVILPIVCVHAIRSLLCLRSVPLKASQSCFWEGQDKRPMREISQETGSYSIIRCRTRE